MSTSPADRPPASRWRGPARTAVAVCVVLLSSSVAGTPASSVPGVAAGAPIAPARSVPALSAPAIPSKRTDLVLLQMNLCNSGMAVSCYTFGAAVDEAVGKIRQHSPSLVMVQEVCRDDMYSLGGWGKLPQAMGDRSGGGPVSVSFVPAKNRYTGRPYQCVNGEQFGIALVHDGYGGGTHYGWYRSQDLSDEVRAWTCATVIEGRLTGCTTHLSTDRDVAMRQCKELVSALRSPWVMPQVVVAGDFNLTVERGRPYDVHRCLPAGYDLRGDGGLQQVFFSSGLQWIQGGTEPMEFTDHPMLYQRLRLRP